MCSIFGSTDKDEFFELAELNGYRGTHSHSIAAVNLYHMSINMIDQGKGPISKVDLPDECLYIGHQQAPTTKANDDSNIHPSKRYGYLWHNGIIKATQVKKWQTILKTDEEWDTSLLQQIVEQGGVSALSDADGSFACIHHLLNELKMFRNDNCPMFINGSSFSSTKFEGSESIESNKVYDFDNSLKKWKESSITFNTKTTFYWSPE